MLDKKYDTGYDLSISGMPDTHSDMGGNDELIPPAASFRNTENNESVFENVKEIEKMAK